MIGRDDRQYDEGSMKIGGTPRYAEIARTGKVKPGGRSDAADNVERSGSGSASAAADTMSIMGVPETELTAKVRTALMTLMREVEELRRDLNRTRARLAELEREADQDTLTPLANRRAFVRELSKVMSFT